jgi:hypothetical protein
VIDRLIAAGHWRPGDPQILIVTDAGYSLGATGHGHGSVNIIRLATCWPISRSSWSVASAPIESFACPSTDRDRPRQPAT